MIPTRKWCAQAYSDTHVETCIRWDHGKVYEELIMARKLTSKQLAFDEGPVPPFLQSLHAQVNRGRANLNDKRGNQPPDEFESFFEGKPDKSKQTIESDDEDEWSGAQVVVMNNEKHISLEEAKRTIHENNRGVPEVQSTNEQPRVATAGHDINVRKRRNIPEDNGASTSSNELNVAKDIIEKSKKQHRDHDDNESKKSEQTEKQKAKQLRRLEKNKAARAEKKRIGKGLSFSLAEE